MYQVIQAFHARAVIGGTSIEVFVKEREGQDYLLFEEDITSREQIDRLKRWTEASEVAERFVHRFNELPEVDQRILVKALRR